MPPPRTQRAVVAERRSKALQLRLAGASWQAVADALGYKSWRQAHNDVDRAIKTTRAQIVQDAQTLREQEVARLDRLQQGLWAKAIGGDPRAVDSVVRIIDRRIRLLGLDVQQDMDDATRRMLTEQIAQRMYVVFARVLDGLELDEGRRAMVPGLLQAAIARFAGVQQVIDGSVADAR